METFEATTERAAHKLDVAQQDEADKGEPYRSDVFFAYLQKRRYGQKDAKGWAPTKLLDRWVARLCDYQTAAVNYKRLKAIPARLETHLENLEMQAQNARDALKLAEQKMLVGQGVEAARKASILAQTKLEKIDAKIAQQEDKHMAVRAEQADVTSGKSGPYAQAIELLSRTLKGKDLRSLSVIASQTTSDDDDRAVKQLSSLRRTGDDLEKDQREASKLLNSQQKSLKELEKVRRKFKQNRYDAPYSQFPSGDLIGALLGQVLIGAISGDGLWGQIRRAQRTVQRSTDIDFGGVDWGEAMRIPRNSRGSRSSRNSRNRNSGWGGGSSRTSRPRAPKISFPKSSGGGRGGGGFRTGGGF